MIRIAKWLVLGVAVLVLPGCGCVSWRQDTRSGPVSPPYAAAPECADHALTEDEAVNAAVGAAALHLAASGGGPFSIQAVHCPCTALGRRVVAALYKMKLADHRSPRVLVWQDVRKGSGEWTFTLFTMPGGEVFLQKKLLLKSVVKASPPEP